MNSKNLQLISRVSESLPQPLGIKLDYSFDWIIMRVSAVDGK